MGYAAKLKRKFENLSSLSGSDLQKRRDDLNQAGIRKQKLKSSFSTHVKGKSKKRGSPRSPCVLYFIPNK